jgi:hypothetical protein
MSDMPMEQGLPVGIHRSVFYFCTEFLFEVKAGPEKSS